MGITEMETSVQHASQFASLGTDSSDMLGPRKIGVTVVFTLLAIIMVSRINTDFLMNDRATTKELLVHHNDQSSSEGWLKIPFILFSLMKVHYSNNYY